MSSVVLVQQLRHFNLPTTDWDVTGGFGKSVHQIDYLDRSVCDEVERYRDVTRKLRMGGLQTGGLGKWDVCVAVLVGRKFDWGVGGKVVELAEEMGGKGLKEQGERVGAHMVSCYRYLK